MESRRVVNSIEKKTVPTVAREEREKGRAGEGERKKKERNTGAMAYLGKHPKDYKAVRHKDGESELQTSRCQHVRIGALLLFNYLLLCITNIFIGI